MRERVNRLQLARGARLHGHAKLELFDAKTKDLIRKVEHDNLVTDAITSLVNNVAAVNAGYLDDVVMPIATKALGGIMLFDGTLTEDASNVEFPSDVSLTGYALQSTNTSNTLCGSINSTESGEISGGYRNVWDFSTSQANGNIYSVALMNSTNDPFVGWSDYSQHDIISSSGGSWSSCAPVYTDGEYQYIISGSGSYTSTYSSGTYTYYTTITVNVYKERIPLTNYKVADSVNHRDYPELLSSNTFSITTTGAVPVNYSNPHLVAHDGGDGKIYFIYPLANSSGSATVFYFTLDTSDWTASDVTSISLAGTYLRAVNGVASNGYMYLMSYDRHSVYKVDLSNTADITTITLESGYYFPTSGDYGHGYMTPNPAGGIWFSCYTAAASGESGYYDHYSGFLNENDVITLNGAYYMRNTSTYYCTPKMLHQNYSYMQGYGRLNTYANYYGGCGRPLTNYLGTICNLATGITKNASQTLKVTYDLYDAS